ncbi:hypothetical protein MPSEU_001033500 [Mayamaea pseudoterrestris]|nr:hypothetical protein MPSEU_001033500 [Mayamaea pseudoterrestris]
MTSLNEERDLGTLIAVTKGGDSPPTEVVELTNSSNQSRLSLSSPIASKSLNTLVASHEKHRNEQIARMMAFFRGESLDEAFSKLKVAPTSRPTSRRLAPQDLVERIFDDGFSDAYLNDGESMRILLFLYAREYFANDEHRRKRELTIFLDSRTTGHQRLMRVIEFKHDTVLSDGAFQEWMDILTAKGYLGNDLHAGVKMIFELFKLQIVFRRQLSGNCFLQAAAVMHCYLLQMGTKRFDGIMDLTRYVRQEYDDVQLSAYTLDDKGGTSVRNLKELLLPRSAIIIMDFVDADYDLVKEFVELPATLRHLETYGPALVSNFKCDPDFMEYGNNQRGQELVLPLFDGQQDESKQLKGGHAMVLVAMKPVGPLGDRHWILLLQNWWERMQFVEITAEYFVSSQASLIWAMILPTEMPSTLPVTKALYAETHVDGCDSLYPLPLDGESE